MKPKKNLSAKIVRNQRSGVALVLTLSLLLVVTVIVTAFFFRSHFDYQASGSYSAGVSSESLARGALANVIGGLLTEASGKGGTGVTLTNGTMVVSNPNRMLPLRAIKNSGLDFPTLLKQSTTSVGSTGNSATTGNAMFDGYSGLTASSVSSGDATATRPGLDEDFWNKPKLTVNPIVKADLPSWIYVAANGSNPTAPPPSGTPSDAVVGRYAFNVYDTGGLIDVNVVGGPVPSAGANFTTGRKGGLPSVSLEAMAPMVSAMAGVQAKLDGFRFSGGVWSDDRLTEIRNMQGLPVSTGTYQSGLATPYFNNAFLSRQDFLSFAKANGITDGALPYLTVFSRDLDMPYRIWTTPTGAPPPNVKAANIAASNSAAGSESIINASPWQNGKNPFNSRFPLDRIALLGSSNTGPTGTAADVKKYFGLTWNGPDASWTYTAPHSGRPNEVIRTLDEVRTQNASKAPKDKDGPNFFETLKAAISVGSIGRQASNAAFASNPDSPQGLFTIGGGQNLHLPGKADFLTDLQILRIGANIIDQWDYDGFPTRIVIPTALGLLPANWVVYGDEDLPYLNGTKQIPYAPFTATTTAADGTPIGEGYYLLHPQVWNPHSNLSGPPADATGTISANAHPTRLRITPWSPTGVKMQTGWTMQLLGPTAWTNAPYPNTCSFTPNKSSFAFNYPSSMDKFRDPVMLLKLSDFPEAVTVTNWQESGDERQIQDNTAIIFRNSPGDSIGVPNGPVNRTGFILSHYNGRVSGYGNNSSGAVFKKSSVVAITHDAINLAMQYSTDGTNWHTYDVMSDCVSGNTSAILNSEAVGMIRPDPRTDRFSAWGTAARVINTANGVTGTTGLQASTALIFSNALANAAQGGGQGFTGSGNVVTPAELASNNGPFRYVDSDGVARFGAAYKKSGNTGNPVFTTSPKNVPTVPQPSAMANSRPIILNRPFVAIGELSYVFRDSPWRNLEFFNPTSGDAGLLDYFCIHASNEVDPSLPPLRAGVVNINSAGPEVLTTLISGANAGVKLSSGTGAGTNPIPSGIATSVANTIQKWAQGITPGGGLLRSRAELVGRFDAGVSYVGMSDTYSTDLGATITNFDNQRSVVTRALADVITTGTWNLLIDVVAQSGNLPTNEKNLGNFVTSGQTRYWLHVAIDRATGKIIDQRLERVF